MFTAKYFQDFSKQFSESLPPPLQALRKEFEEHFSRGMMLAFSKMNLVTREQFDIQAKVLERTREKLEQLEQKLEELEKNLDPKRSQDTNDTV